MPLRAVTTGVQATTSLVEAGITIAAIPLREGARAISGELPQDIPATLSRRCWRGEERAWIEVRGLDGAEGDALGRAVLDAVLAHPGIASAALNYPLSRVVVTFGDADTSLRDLCHSVEAAEKRCTPKGFAKPMAPPTSLPGDGVVLATRAATAAASAAGLGIALTGRALRWPRMPVGVLAAVVAVDYQPWLRRLLEDRIGRPATDTVLALAVTTAETLTLSPASLSVGLLMQSLKAAECRAEARAWVQHEPQLASHADHPHTDASARSKPARGRPADHHADRFALVQAISAGVVGATTRNLHQAALAVLVTTPAANRTTPEAFAAALGQGLADRHAVLSLRPEALRRLDRVDAIVIDPRVLCTKSLRVSLIRGAREAELSAAWSRAQLMLENHRLRPGWHPVPGIAASSPTAKVEALFCFTHDPLASAVVAEAHRTGSELVSVEDDSLGELRPAFDEITPVERGSVDDALARAVADLQQAGRTVAVLSSPGAQAIWAADVALGMMPEPGAGPPPWYADLLLPDLAAAWRVLHALPAARAAAQRGVGISAGATAMGSLLMIPGVRGIGRGPVTTGAAAGLMSGYLLARGIIKADAPRPAPVQEWHAMAVEHVRRALPPPDSEPAGDPRQLALAALGAPQPETRAHAFLQFVVAVRAELTDPLTPVLALGSAASAVLGSPVDAVLVFSVLAGNSMLAASQRLRAENRLNHLLAQQIPPARKVMSDGADRVYTDVIAAQLQPGDVIEVRTHEVVPADARIIEEVDVEVDESTLTGESLSVEKQVEPTPGAALAERRCMLYAGTTVVAGTAVAVVTAVGADTQERRAAELVSGDLSSDIGLQHQLSQLTNRAFPVSMTGGALVSVLGLLRGSVLRQAVASGIAIAVAAVPEGMPLVATLAQAASARRLTKFGALVRVPRSVEALGRIDVVCFDKTGTLSQNRLRVAEVVAAPGTSREEVLRCAAHAAPASNGNPHVHATDVAIVEAAAAVPSLNGHNSNAPVAHLPFRSGRSFSASVTDTELAVKGAPEVVLAACGNVSPALEETVAQMAGSGLRVIAVARRQLSPAQARAIRQEPDDIADFARDGLTLTGFLGLSDTPRAEAADLLADLRRLSVGVKLITGDHPITAKAIAEELGLSVTAEQVISGAEWDAMSRKDQERVVTERVIFARMTPENKVQVVQTLESAGVRTAMVGDGANDAAAIRAATVGIGVVAGGSDPAHMAADVVLVDARIEGLLHAIEEGRQLWQRVQAAVSVLLGGNAGEVLFAIVGSAITGTSPLNTRQLLLVNMMTDALPAAALAVSKPSGPVDPGIRGPDQPALWRAVAIRGVTTAAATTAAWAMGSVTGRPQRASTVALVALVGAELGQTLLDSHAPLVVFTAVGSLAAMGTLISIPVVSQLLGCTPLGPVGWAQGLGSAAAATVAIGVLNRALTGPGKSADTRAEVREPRRPRPAIAAHRVPVTAPSAPEQ
ncbi:cation-translocating P-type ATPase [Mycobacterium sp. E2733]|uniref:cation-translocating P-type ATPase n=1 Tax=Mycobacterium sp. E2733 TaxID=1834138 RepID=UPI000AA0A346